MPTTNSEAETAVAIVMKYMSPVDMHACFTELDERVGKVSANDSVKQSFKMLRELCGNIVVSATIFKDGVPLLLPEKEFEPRVVLPPGVGRLCATEGVPVQMWQPEHIPFASLPTRRFLYCWLVLWALLAYGHMAMVVVNVAAFFVAPFYAPWYLAAPACFAIIWVATSPVDCVITKWENAARAHLGWSPVKRKLHQALLHQTPHGVAVRWLGEHLFAPADVG